MFNKIFSKIILVALSFNVFASDDYKCDFTFVSGYSEGESLDRKFKIEVPGTSFMEYGDDNKTVRVERDGFLTDIYVGINKYDFQVAKVLVDSSKELKVSIEDKAKKEKLMLRLYKNSNLGVVLIKREDSYKTLATFDCNDYSKQNKIVISGGIHKKIRFEKLPENVKKMMGNVDVPFEMGDGYYDLKKREIFIVLNEQKIVQGYIVESTLTYTEDPELASATDYYQLNGIRFASSMWR